MAHPAVQAAHHQRIRAAPGDQRAAPGRVERLTQPKEAQRAGLGHPGQQRAGRRQLNQPAQQRPRHGDAVERPVG